MPSWLALALWLLGLVVLARLIARGMRHHAEDIARTNRPMPPEALMGETTSSPRNDPGS